MTSKEKYNGVLSKAPSNYKSHIWKYFGASLPYPSLYYSVKKCTHILIHYSRLIITSFRILTTIKVFFSSTYSCLKHNTNINMTPKEQYYVNIHHFEGRNEGSVLFNDALNTFYLRLYGVGHMVEDHSDSERGNPLPPHGLLFPINSKGSFICTIPYQDSTYHGLC